MAMSSTFSESFEESCKSRVWESSDNCFGNNIFSRKSCIGASALIWRTSINSTVILVQIALPCAERDNVRMTSALTSSDRQDSRSWSVCRTIALSLSMLGSRVIFLVWFSCSRISSSGHEERRIFNRGVFLSKFFSTYKSVLRDVLSHSSKPSMTIKSRRSKSARIDPGISLTFLHLLPDREFRQLDFPCTIHRMSSSDQKAVRAMPGLIRIICW